MSSFPRSKGKYHVVQYRSGDKSKSFYFPKKLHRRGEIEEWRRERDKEYKAGKWSPFEGEKKQSKPVRPVLKEYRRRIEKELAPSTVKERMRILNYLLRQTEEWTEDVLTEFVNADLKYKTKMKRLEAVRGFYTFALEQGYAAMPDVKVYATRAEKKRAKRAEKTWIEVHEFDAVKKAAASLSVNNNYALSKTHYREFEQEFPFVFDFLVHTGFRRADLINLNLDNYLGDRLKIGDDHYTPKSQEAVEMIPLTEEAQAILRRWKDRYGQRPFAEINPNWLSKYFKKVFRKALPEKAEKLSLHKMRDTAAMYLLFEKGYSPQTVREITRHNDLATLMIYVHRSTDLALREMKRINSALNSESRQTG